MRFYDKLSHAWDRSDSLVCVGLDPDMEKMPPHLAESPRPYFEFCRQVMDATADLVCAFKPQAAHFAAVGREQELADTFDYARTRHPEVVLILDAKRGDVGSTAKYYAMEAYDRYAADAVTVNPYLGEESVTPYLAYTNKGVIVLCRTSNPDSDWLQHRETAGAMLFEEVARRSRSWNEHRQCMLVAGATNPSELGKIRSLVGDMPLLVPGIGAQGGDLKAVLAQGLDGEGRGLVISSSRAIIYASQGHDFADAARQAASTLKDEINYFRNRFNNNT